MAIISDPDVSVGITEPEKQDWKVQFGAAIRTQHIVTMTIVIVG